MHSVLALVFLLGAAYAQSNEGLVQTTNGPVLGNVLSNYRSFLGMRYTGAPIGAYRYAAPPALPPWTSPANAQSFGPGCPQICELPPHTCPNVTSEDCLTINVYTPRVAAMNGSLVAVLVYLAGGRFEQGTGGTPLYSGHLLSPTSNIIVVTLNYRLGALGFFYTDQIAGNFALSDQRLALQWVQANIKNFGGDPTRVTLSGQSAGAISVVAHLMSPISKGLFSQAIVQSDPLTLGFKSKTDALAMSKKYAKDQGCDWHDLTCMRNANISSILAAQKAAQSKIDLLHVLSGFMPWLPTIDGTTIPTDQWTAFSTGKYQQMPIMIGTVWEEARLFIYQAWNESVSDLDYIAILTAVYSIHMPDVLKMYPDEQGPDNRDVLSVMGTDYIFHCPTRWWARTVSAQQPSIPVYQYSFNHSWSFPGWGPNFPDCVGHVCHGAELPFVFDAAEPFFNFTLPEQALSYELSNFWGNFVNSGNPNLPLPVVPHWDPFTQSSNLTAVFLTGTSATGSMEEANLQESTCDFWDRLGYQF